MTTDYAAETRLLEQFFVRRGLSRTDAQDLAQDTWVKLLGGLARGNLTHLRGAYLTAARWVHASHARRPASAETPVGELAEDAGVIQLYTDADDKERRRAAQRDSMRRLRAKRAQEARA